MFEHGDLRDPSMVSWFSKRALLGLRDEVGIQGQRAPHFDDVYDVHFALVALGKRTGELDRHVAGLRR